jgi:hypothetical protein
VASREGWQEMTAEKINKENIVITLVLVFGGISLGTLTKLPDIQIPIFQIFENLLPSITMVGVIFVVVIVAYLVYMLVGTCGMTGRMC